MGYTQTLTCIHIHTRIHIYTRTDIHTYIYKVTYTFIEIYVDVFVYILYKYNLFENQKTFNISSVKIAGL